jgi:hypothetical protein
MSNPADYRRYAAECLELAGTVSDPRARASLAHIAEVWLRLADEKDAGDWVKEPADQCRRQPYQQVHPKL